MSDENGLSAVLRDRDNSIRALDELFTQSAEYHSSKEYYALLNFINRFKHLSPFNAFLVHTQNNGVQIVATSKEWMLRYNRTVIPYSRPLVILRPFGPVSFVYDIANTEGPPIPDQLTNPFGVKGELDSDFYNLTLKHSLTDEIPILEKELHKSVAGYATNRKGQFIITISSKWTMEEKYSTIVHELAHVFCGHLGKRDNDWWHDRSQFSSEIEEFEAESVAYLVCKRVGIETTSSKYLSDYLDKNGNIPPVSIETILTVTGYIESMGTTEFNSKNRAKRKQA
jgi:hypothetical protein